MREPRNRQGVTTMSSPEPTSSTSPREEEIQLIREALQGLRYGSVNVVVQDGVVVQIDRMEKRRLRSPSPDAARLSGGE